MSESQPPSQDNSSLGLKLFVVYVLLYGGFVLINALSPSTMEKRIFSLNLALIYGVGLIIAALLLSLVYAWLCREVPSRDEEKSE